MSRNRDCIYELEAMRHSMHIFFHTTLPNLKLDLLRYADELDKAYRDIKISKIAGSAGCVVGGVLSTVGFGLSFFTFGASLGLCIAGGVIAGAGGVTSGGTSIADFVLAKDAKKKAACTLGKCDEAFGNILKECKSVSDKLEQTGAIESRFPFWCGFWKNCIFASGQVAIGGGWQMIANTVKTAIKISKPVDIATDVTSTVVPVFRTFGKAAKGFHIAGGFVSAVFIPFDIYSLCSNSAELHTNKAHVDSNRIREAVKDIDKKIPTKAKIDEVIDKCISELRQ